MTDNIITKICTICKIEQSISNFYSRKEGAIGVVFACKPCFLERKKYPTTPPSIENLPDEEWRVCVENFAYAVSNKGRVKRTVSHRYSQNGESLLTPVKNRNGYLHVTINPPLHSRVHRLVCRAFHGEPLPHQTDVNHIDNDRTNNCADNLHWCTRKENLNWASQQGRMAQGEKNGTAKLTESNAKEIIHLLKTTARTHVDIGNQFHVSDGAVQLINVGKRWKHLTQGEMFPLQLR